MSKYIPATSPTRFAAMQSSLSESMAQLLAIAAPKGVIRATRPKAAKGADKATCDLYEDAAYVWRFVVFQVSQKSEHHCMPCLVFVSNAGLPACPFNGSDDRDNFRAYIDAKRAKEKTLLALADKLVDCVDKAEWHGITRWGKAMGVAV